MSSSNELPKVVVFDLDGCVWEPEMYQLTGGAPFQVMKNGNLKDSNGEEVYFLKDVKSILYELKTSDKWKDTQIAVASTCTEPHWAEECIKKFSVGDGILLDDVFGQREIHYGNKADHLRSISKATGVGLKDMIFFDDRMHNCKAVASVGVTVLYVPHGITREAFDKAINDFPQPGKILDFQ